MILTKPSLCINCVFGNTNTFDMFCNDFDLRFMNCKVCMAAPVETVFVPCGHMARQAKADDKAAAERAKADAKAAAMKAVDKKAIPQKAQIRLEDGKVCMAALVLLYYYLNWHVLLILRNHVNHLNPFLVYPLTRSLISLTLVFLLTPCYLCKTYIPNFSSISRLWPKL